MWMLGDPKIIYSICPEILKGGGGYPVLRTEAMWIIFYFYYLLNGKL